MDRRQWGKPPRGSIRVPSLTVVELVMELEETFGLVIRDDDSERIFGVGGIKEYVCEHVPLRPAADCATQRAFYRLRRVVCEETDLPRAAVRPRARWADLLPVDERDRLWIAITHGASVPAPTSFERQPADGSFWSWRQPLPPLPGRLPRHRDTVGATARLIAAYEHSPTRRPDGTWTREEIALTVERLVASTCEITDFADDLFLED